MKKALQLFIFLTITITSSQGNRNNNWQLFSLETITYIDVNKTDSFVVSNFKFEIVWDKQLSYSENIGYYGGIKKLSIFKENEKIQIIDNIEDNVAIGKIYFSFYDYNFDGYIDFSIPIDCGKNCWDKYYIFNPKSKKFEHKKSWDYLRIQKIDKKNKLILSQPDGNAFEDNRKTYKIKGMEINEIGGK
jgi:hypothetical protein